MFIFSLWISAPILRGLPNRTKTVLQLRYSAASVLFFFFFFSPEVSCHIPLDHILHPLFVMMQTLSPGLCALASATVVTPLLYASGGCHRVPAGSGWDDLKGGWHTWPRENVERICKWARQQRLFGICEMNEILPLSFPHFPSHIFVTRLVKSLSLKLPKVYGAPEREAE